MARSPFGSPEEKRRPPEQTRPPVETKPLEKEGEDTAGSFEDCQTEQKAAEQQKLEQAQEKFDECAEREREAGDKVGAESPEEFDEDEYEECGGHYVAQVEYRVTDPEQGAISQAEADAAYGACADPENMQELADNLEARGGIKVESAEVIERPDPAVELHGTEAEKQEFIEAHQEADEAAEELAEAEAEAAAAQEAEPAAEATEEAPEQPPETEQTEEQTEENTGETAEEAEETAEGTTERSAEETAEQTGEGTEEEEPPAEQAEDTAEQTEGSAENTEETAEQTEKAAEKTEEAPEKSDENAEDPEEAPEDTAGQVEEGERSPEEAPGSEAEQPEDREETEETAEQPEENPETEGERFAETDAETAPEEAAERSAEETSAEDPEAAAEASPEREPEEAPEEPAEPAPEEKSEETAEQKAETAPEEETEAETKRPPEATGKETGEQAEEPAEEEAETAPEEKSEGKPEGEEETAPAEESKEISEEETEPLPEEKAEETAPAETDEEDPEAAAQARERGEAPLPPEQAEAERVDIEKNASQDGELRPDDDTFRRLSIEQHACEQQVEQTKQQLEQARQQAAESFANIPPFGSAEYKDALKAYNEARDRQQQLEEKLAASQEQLEELESTRRTLYQQAFDGKQRRMNEIDQLQIRASEQQDRAEGQIYAEHPNKEEMSRIADSNTDLIRRLADAEAGLDAMIAARRAELAQYAAQNDLGRWESEHDPRFLQMVQEQQEWIQKKSELSYLRAKAEEDNRQLEELQQQTQKGLFGRLADKLRGRTDSAEAKNAESPKDVEGNEGDEFAELRRLGVEKIDLDECREEYRPQVIEAVRSMLEKNPELVGQVKEIRCWKMPDYGTLASYGPSEMDEPFGGVLNLNASRFSSPELPGELETAGKNGWFVPESDVRSIVTHEMGHAVHLELCAIRNGIEHGQVPDPEAYCRMLEAYKENYHADTIVEAACKSYGIEFDSEAFADSLSGYGSGNYGEALAEAEAEAQNSPHPRPMALRIHAALQTYKQNLVEWVARRKAESQAPTEPEQPVPTQTAKQAAAPENDFIRRLRKDAPTPEQQEEAVRRWQQRRKMGAASGDGSDVMHGDGGARTRDTERDDER